MTTVKKKLIETSLPLEAINVASAREKSIRHGHPYAAFILVPQALSHSAGRAFRPACRRSSVAARRVSHGGIPG